MKRVYIIIYAVLLLLPISVGAQSLSNSERRHINYRVLSLIEEYERVASLYDDESAFYFESLFERGQESMVFCDMIGSESYLQTIPVSEYIRQLRTYASTVNTVIKDVKKGNMTYDNGIWRIPVILKKTFSYVDNDGYMFSVEDYHKSDIDIRLNLIYDPESDVCVIASIDGDLDSDKDFPQGRFLIVNENRQLPNRHLKYLSSLKIGNDNIKFNEFGQAVLPGGEAYVDDIDVEVLADTLNKGFNYDVVSFGFYRRNSRVKLRYGYSPGAFKVIDNSNLITAESPAMEFGFDLGVAIATGKKSKFGLYTGIGVMNGTLKLYQNSNIKYTYSTGRLNEDKIWEPVNVAYQIQSATESATYLDVFIPVYFEVEHKLGNHMMLAWSLGAKGYYSLSSTPGEQSVRVTASIGNSQSSTQTEKKTFSPSFYQSASTDATAFANIGLDVNLFKKRVYFMARAGYEYGFMLKYKSDLAPYYKSGSSPSYPVIYDAASNEHVIVHPMVNGLEFYRRGWWFSGGIKFKL